MGYYFDQKKAGKLLHDARVSKFGSRSRSWLCDVMNDDYRSGVAHYSWNDSDLAKIEKGQKQITLDKLCELCMYLSIYPTDVISQSTYC